MSSITEIKHRIQSVRDTKKITNAMHLIASTKVRKAKSELDKTRPYFSALQKEIERIFSTEEDIDSRYFYPHSAPPSPAETFGVLVVTADKGLAGAYNINVIKEAKKLCDEHPNTKLFVVGEFGRQYFSHRGVPVEKSFLYTAQNPTLRRAREIANLLVELFDRGELDEIFVVYTDFKSGREEEVRRTQLLPLHRSDFSGGNEVSAHFEYEPSAAEVLDNVVLSLVTGFVYSALVDSYCSEQNARMDAMSTADQNADELLKALSLEFNRARQAAITQEITEVSSGAKGMKRKNVRKR